MKIVIAGGSGFIGHELIRYFGNINSVTVFTRSLTKPVNNRYENSGDEEMPGRNLHFVKWDGKTLGDWTTALEEADLLINLSGRSVNCQYTQKNKEDILQSRIMPVIALGKAIRQCSNPPVLWINASSATIYRHATDHPQDEYHGEIRNDFSVQVCKAWEKTFFDQEIPATRMVALRLAITLGQGGVMFPYFNLLKYGLSGQQGKGNQMYSWVHASDLCRAISWIHAHPEMKGVYNISAPNPVTNAVFMATLRKLTGHTHGLPAPAWLLKAGAALIGTEAELLLKSRWVLPTRLMETGFSFQYKLLEEALQEIINQTAPEQYRLF